MRRRIDEAKREEMFSFWQEKQSINYVSQKAQVSRRTADRYRAMDNWDQRLAKIRAKAQKKTDETAAERLSRHARLAKILQAKAFATLDRFEAFSDVNTAVRALEVSVRMEREAMGDADRLMIMSPPDERPIEEIVQSIRSLNKMLGGVI